MTLPEEIPESLSRSAVDLPDLQVGEAAWSDSEALRVLDSLVGSLLPVVSVAVFERAPWGHAASGTGWSADPLIGELEREYAQRTRSSAKQFILEHRDNAGSDTLYVLRFPIGKDAA